MKLRIERSTEVQQTARVKQASGLFDLPPSPRSQQIWDVDLELPPQWNVGVIVGPSGAGKTTVAREVFGQDLVAGWEWPADRSILDGFPAGMGIKDITGLLSSVGFSSPPAWLRPFHVLSNGQQFRVNLARTLAEYSPTEPGRAAPTGSIRAGSVAVSRLS
jgi:ABC-type glutathione transport system ATPase component